MLKGREGQERQQRKDGGILKGRTKEILVDRAGKELSSDEKKGVTMEVVNV